MKAYFLKMYVLHNLFMSESDKFFIHYKGGLEIRKYYVVIYRNFLKNPFKMTDCVESLIKKSL